MNKIFVLICALFTLSCSNKPVANEDKEVYTINLDNGKSNRSIAQKVGVTNILRLNCSDSVSLSNSNYIKRIYHVKGRNYIFDSKFMAINVFDTIGNYVGQIGSLGTGYGQFSNLQDVQYDKRSNTLVALCNSPRKIIEFSPTGKVLKEMPISFFASNFTINESNSFYFFRNQNFGEKENPTNLVRTDNKYKIKSDFFEIRNGLNIAVGFAGAVFGNGTEVFYNPPFERTIYEIRDDQGYAQFKVNFGSLHNIDYFTPDSAMLYLINKSIITNNLLWINDFLLFNYTREGQKKLAIFDKKIKITYSSEAQDPLDNLFNESVFFDGNRLALLITPSYKYRISDLQKKELEKRFPLLYDELSRTDSCDFPLIAYLSINR